MSFANELVLRDLVDLEAFRRWRDDVDRDVGRRGRCGEGVEHTLVRSVGRCYGRS